MKKRDEQKNDSSNEENNLRITSRREELVERFDGFR